MTTQLEKRNKALVRGAPRQVAPEPSTSRSTGCIPGVERERRLMAPKDDPRLKLAIYVGR